MFAVPRDRVVLIHASSQTTGRSTVASDRAQDLPYRGAVVGGAQPAFSGLQLDDLS
jgi:phenylacetate-coenzyme A ligase PaaK-like adenylate-forming protein